MSENDEETRQDIDSGLNASLDSDDDVNTEDMEIVSDSESDESESDSESDEGESDSVSSDMIHKGWSSTHICWIQKVDSYRAMQEYHIKEKRDATELFHMMKRISETLDINDDLCYRRWWLNTATTYNHMKLVDLMLTDKSFELNNNVPCGFIKPLYIAIEKGNLSLVRTFLHAGASVTYNPYNHVTRTLDNYYVDHPRVHDLSSDKYLHEYVTAVEYACIVNQPEVMKVLVSHYEHQYLQRTHSGVNFRINFERASRRNKEPEENRFHPLHNIMMLATKLYGQNLAKLPAFVRLIIEASCRSVHYIDKYFRTPLQFLLANVWLMYPQDEAAIEHRRIIVEVTEILLKAGSRTNMKHFKDASRDTLHRLLRDIDCMGKIDVQREHVTHYQVACIYRNNLQLVNDLTRLLLLNGADLTRYRFYEIIPIAAVNILRDLAKTEYGPGCLSVCDEIMNSLSCLFRYALFAGAKRLTNKDWSDFLEVRPVYVSRLTLIHCFIRIADYSSQPGRSQKLLYIILSALSANNIQKLKKMLIAVKEQPELIYTQSGKEVNQALKYVDNINIPHNLEYMACRAINRAMSTRTLACSLTVGLGLPIPPHIESLVLYE